jgi:hypothetical protein
MNHCKCCGDPTENPKFCGRSCAAKINNVGVRRHGPIKYNCQECGNQSKKQRKYCSSQCRKRAAAAKLSDLISRIEGDEAVRWASIRRYLIVKIGRCQCCGISSWQDKPITFECDHIDGDRSRDVLSNARLLCPNCHSQTVTFRAKNMTNPKGKEFRRSRYLRDFKMASAGRVELPFSVPITDSGLEDRTDYAEK